MPRESQRHLLLRPGEYNPWHDWDGDPLTLPPEAVRRLRTDEGYAALVFANPCEAFNAGLAIGAAVAAARARRQAS